MIVAVRFWSPTPGIEDYALRFTSPLGNIVESLAVEVSERIYEATVDLPDGFYVVRIGEGNREVGFDVLAVGNTTLANIDGLPLYYLGSSTSSGNGGSDVDADEVASTVVSAIKGLKAIHVNSPTLVGNRITTPVVQCDSYKFNADPEQDRSITFSRSSFPDFPLGTTVQMEAARHSDGQPFSVVFPMTTVSRSGSKTVRLELTSEQTVSLAPGCYAFNVVVKFPSNETACFVGPNAFFEVIPRVASPA